jgi:hypothetical protein
VQGVSISNTSIIDMQGPFLSRASRVIPFHCQQY